MTETRISLGSYNFEAADVPALARFWEQVTGATAEISGEIAYLPPNGPGGFGLFLQPASEPRPDRQAAHLDLTVPWGSREAEVSRLVAAGAIVQWEVLDESPHVQWTTLTDPEGNLFCLAEHPPHP